MYKESSDFIYELVEAEQNWVLDMESWVNDSENENPQEAKKELKVHQDRLKKLQKCYQFLFIKSKT